MATHAPRNTSRTRGVFFLFALSMVLSILPASPGNALTEPLSVVSQGNVGDALRKVVRLGSELAPDNELDASRIRNLTDVEARAISDQFPTADVSESRAVGVMDISESVTKVFVADVYVHDTDEAYLEVQQALLLPNGRVAEIESTGLIDVSSGEATETGPTCTTTCNVATSVGLAAGGLACSGSGPAYLLCVAAVSLTTDVLCTSICTAENPVAAYSLAPPDCWSTYSCGIRGEGWSINGKVTKASNLVEWVRSPTSVYSTHSTTITWVSTLSADEGTFATFAHASASGVTCSRFVRVDATVTDRYGRSMYAASGGPKNHDPSCSV